VALRVIGFLVFEWLVVAVNFIVCGISSFDVVVVLELFLHADD
jgi:hypothetical protein